MASPFHEGGRRQPQEPAVVQIDPKCLHSALKEFFDPLRSNDPRTDFFAMYRRESGEFDRDYAKKYDEDLNTSLIFAGLFSAVSSAFIIDVQSKLEPDPNDMTAAYMRILVHTMNNSLFPDADPSSATWTGPPPEIVAVQSFLYASLATSLFAAFLAMLGKQWVNRYLRNHGGSAADKSRDRQRKLDGLEKWHFHIAIESLPVMLQLALLLLGCALSRYLWTISRTAAGVIVAVTLFGVTSYVSLTLAATFYYNCPYQTPPSILTRTLIRYLAHYGDTFTCSLRSLITPPSIKVLRKIHGCLRSGFRGVLESVGCIPTVPGEEEHIPLSAVVAPPIRIFDGVPTDWDVCLADIRCISWVLYSTTDTDVIFSTVRFATEVIWYPGIAGTLSPHVLADFFFDCLLDGRVIPGKVEYASSIGMALASVLSIQLITEPKNPVLRELCERILSARVSSPEPIFILVTDVLRFVADSVERTMFKSWGLLESIPDHLSATQKLWLSRVILQTLWRWRRVREPTKLLDLLAMGPICRTFTADGDKIPSILKTNCFLAMATSLGAQIDIRDLYVPSTVDALRATINLFFQQLQICIREGLVDRWYLTVVLSASARLNPFQVMGDGELGISLITGLLDSGYPEDYRYKMAGEVVQRLGKWFESAPLQIVEDSWIPALFGFLSLCEKFYAAESSPHPGFIALRILSTGPIYGSFCETVLPVLTSTLLPTHPLQSRRLALRVFDHFTGWWLSFEMENTRSEDLAELLQAVGDLFQFPDLPLQDGRPVAMTHYNPMATVLLLIEFASLDLWRNHLRPSNFTSCEEIMSTREGKKAALKCMFDATTGSSAFLHAPGRMIEAIERLEELQCFNTAEVMILWAWTTGVVNPVDRDGWGSIGGVTLWFYQKRRRGRLATLSQHITDTTMAAPHLEFLVGRYGRNPCRVRQPSTPVAPPVNDTDLCISRTCQLGRLYHLFGCDPATWREMVAAEGVGVGAEAGAGMVVGGGIDMSSLMPSQFTDWACDYP